MSSQHPSNGEEIAAIPKGRRILAMSLRALVLGALVAMTVHLSSPQSETIWTVHDTPGDLIRLALGLGERRHCRLACRLIAVRRRAALVVPEESELPIA